MITVTGFSSTAVARAMAGRVGAFLKNAWAKEPVITVACGIGLGALLLPIVSPFTKYTVQMNKTMPYNYPVPVRDDGNMPDIPSHPADPQGCHLEWLKNV